MLKLVMNRGEQRTIRLRIRSCDGSNFEISSARYEVYQSKQRLILESSGACGIDKNVVFITFCPEESGIYQLRYIMEIGAEVVVKKIHITVDR